MIPHTGTRLRIHRTLLQWRSKTESSHGRRPGLCGIPPYAGRIELAERMREIIAAQAQQRIKAGMPLSIQDNPRQNFAEGSNPDERKTNARLGALAGVSRTAQHAATATRIHSPGLRARAEGYTTTSYSEDGEERMRRKRKQRLSMKDLGGSYPVYRRYGPEPLPERSGEREERGEQAREDHQREEDRA